MRDYFHIDRYLSELEKDTYYQPQHGDLHLEWSKNVIDQWVTPLKIENVLDVGCGVGFCHPMFAALGIEYTGITTNSADLRDGWDAGWHIMGEDYNFIHANANTYDLIFARHSLEHSPMPIITLMEWHRVAKQYLILVNPNPGGFGWTGRNHYSVAGIEQLKFWVERAGWRLLQEHVDDKEFWIHAEKIERKIPFYEH